MVILCYDNNKINRHLSFIGNVDKMIEKLNITNYKVFENTDAYVGLDIRAINDDGSIMPLSKQVELGYFVLTDDENLDGENIVKLTQEELEEKYPDRYPKPKEPTELEKILQEKESLELKRGFELLRKMGEEDLLKPENTRIYNDDTNNTNDRIVYKQILDKIKELIKE